MTESKPYPIRWKALVMYFIDPKEAHPNKISKGSTAKSEALREGVDKRAIVGSGWADTYLVL